MALTREWEHTDRRYGAKRLPFTAGMGAQAAAGASTAIVCDWLARAFAYGEPRRDDFEHALQIGDELGQTVGATRFGDALLPLETQSWKTGVSMALQGSANQEWSEKNLTKALEALPEGHYIVFAHEKNRATLYWFTAGFITHGAKECRILDPFEGQWKGKRSDAAKHLVARAAGDRNPVQARLEGLVIVKATPAPIDRKLQGAMAAFHHSVTETANRLTREAKAIKLGSDLRRMLPGWKIVHKGQVVRDRGPNPDAKTTLQALVTALGSDWAFPEDPKYWDPGTGAEKLNAYVQESVPLTNPLRKIFQLCVQEAMITDIAQLNNLLGVPRHEPMNNERPRYREEDRWQLDIEVTDQAVKIVHAVSLQEGNDVREHYKFQVKVTRTLNRSNGQVTTAMPTYTVRKGQ